MTPRGLIPAALGSVAPQALGGGPAPFAGAIGPVGEQEPLSPSATDEEEEDYRAFMGNVAKMIYDQTVLPKIVENLGAGDPVDSLAQATAMIVMRVEDSAREQTGGGEIDPDILLNAGRETVGAVAEIGEKAGIHQYTEEELEGAYLSAVDRYRAARQKQGKFTDPNPAREELAQMAQADQAGAMNQQYPNVAAYADHVKARFGPGGIEGAVADAAAGTVGAGKPNG